MKRFLNNESGSFFDPETVDLPANALLRKIAPEKQALTVEELAHLVKEDQLDKKEEEEEEEKGQAKDGE